MDENMSYLKTSTDVPLRNSTLSDLMDEALAKYKNDIFIKSRHENKSVTYEEIVEEADNLAMGLAGIGLKIGDKIGIIVNNSVDAFVVNFACIRGGFVSVNLCPALQKREFEYCIKKVQITCIITVDKYKSFSVLDILKKVLPEIHNSENCVVDSENVPSIKSIVIISDIIYKGTFNYENIKLSGKNKPKESIKNVQKKIRCHDVVLILFTSGTTGNPKAVGKTHYQLYNSFYFLHLHMGLYKKIYKFCFYLPLFHLFGQLFIFLSLYCGANFVLPSYYYNPEENLKAISEENCTFLMGSPTMFTDLINIQKLKKLPLSPERALTGSAISPNGLLRDIKDVLNVETLAICYGSTEALVVTWNWLDDVIVEEGDTNSVGSFLEHLEAKIVDNDGNVVPVGTVGHLWLKGYSVINDYLHENASEENFAKDGWYKTGDAICFDKNKIARISGRLKDVINRGGEKISPLEVEGILETHPDILEAGVVGTYHERLGEEVCACLITKPESNISLEVLKAFCKEKLSYYKIPSRIHILDSFPKTDLGKLQRPKLLMQINKSLVAQITDKN